MQLSPKQVRKLVLLAQGIYQEKKLGLGIDATLNAIEKLGYVQIDTISVVERAHHHTVWNRALDYKIEYLNALQEGGQIFEYWSHAAAYLPMRDFRFSLPRKHRFKTGVERHWRDRDPTLMSQVLERITAEGPLQSKEFANTKQSKTTGWWDWKPTKAALEQLYMEGDLMVSKRQGFQKVYDLSERVLNSDIDTRMPSETEFQQHLIERYLHANGLGTSAQISYLRKGLKSKVEARCQEMLEDGALIKVSIKNQSGEKQSSNHPYYALPNALDRLSKPLSQSKVRILSPFDNLLIQRKRTLELFNFDYQIECYVPEAKRQYGYFCMPLLWGQTFAGRMDAKMDRKTGVLHIINCHLETTKENEFKQALTQPLNDFLAFNGGRQIVFE